MKFFESATAKGALINGLISLVAVFTAVLLPSVLEAPRLRAKVAGLEDELATARREKDEAETLLVPFKTIAFQNFTGSEAERLSQLAIRLNDVQKGLESLSSDQSEIRAKTEQINAYAVEAREKTAELESIVTKASSAQQQLGELAEFNMLITRANNDDRVAFDQLLQITLKDDHPNSSVARSAVIQIATDVGSVIRANADLSKLQFNPATASLGAYRRFIETAPRPDYAAAAIDSVLAQDRFTKRERIQLLVDVIRSTVSVRALSAACLAVNQEAKIDRNIIGWREYIDWWDKHREFYL